MYPVVLDLTGRKCLVIGGGQVACRKVQGLLAAHAEVVVVSPESDPLLRAAVKRGECLWHRRDYETDDLDGVFLVFAATSDPVLQKRIALEAGQADIPVNVADHPELCTFHVPATVRRGDFQLSVATGGGSPALAARVRRRLEEEFGPEYGILVRLLGELRPLIIQGSATQAERKTLFQNILHDDILRWIAGRKWNRLCSHLENIVGPECIPILERLREEEEKDCSDRGQEGF
jgi:precorrin-2 dehydrogenase/sirohydrochlorin ferrochelatase